MLKAHDVAEETARAVVAAVTGLRRMPLGKPPGIAEAIEWVNAAAILEGGSGCWPEAFRRAIGVAIKDEDDLAYVTERLDPLLEAACA